MSRSWNGADLVDELSALLGDSSESFQRRVLGWANDVIFDVSTRHDWGHHLTKGKKKLTQGVEVHALETVAPGAPSVALASGGSLLASSTYRVLVTFAQDNGVESKAGEASAALTPTGATLSINLTDIPTSDESLVTSRRLYLSKDDGEFYYHSTISDNFATIASISTETTSAIEAPDYEAIRRIKGSPFFEQESIYLTYRDIDQLRMLSPGTFPQGTPEYFSPVDNNFMVIYPLPSSDMEVSFNYYRNPHRLYDSTDSQPDLPISLKPAVKAGIIAMGFEYRDRAGQEMKRANYENALIDAINRGGRLANIEYSVRDVYGNLNGFEVG